MGRGREAVAVDGEQVPGRVRLLLDAWPLALALLLCGPLLVEGGYPLARDLVFVPRPPLDPALLGFSGTAPRAVPLDLVVALASQVLDGAVLARVVLPLVLATAGWGAWRLVGAVAGPARPGGVLPGLVAGGLAVWNPYVVERLALGQWALLAAWAALPWLLAVAVRLDRAVCEDRRAGPRAVLALVGWLAVASLTPTGGLLGLVVVATVVAGRRARAWWPVAAAAVLQLPWVLAGLLGGSRTTSDPAGVTAFAAQGEGPGGVWVSVLGGGGIWHDPSVPATRGAWWSVAAAALAVLAVLVGRRRTGAVLGPRVVRRLLVLGVVALGCAALPALPAGRELLEWAVVHVPGAGLARDSQKLLAPWLLLVVVSAGGAVAAAVARVRRHGSELVVALGIAVVPLPLVLLPDGAVTVAPTLEPVRYPAGLGAAADVVARARAAGDERPVVTLPWRSYRLFSWGSGVVSSDPALRVLEPPVLVSDDLQVGPVLVRGESVEAARTGAALARLPVLEALREVGAGWALVYRDDPDAGDLDLAGLDAVVVDEEVALYAVPPV